MVAERRPDLARCLLVSLCLLAGYAAPATSAQLRAFACEPEWGALLNEISAGRVEIFTATTALQDPHRIEARPSLIAAWRRADLMLCTGAGLEDGWLPALSRKGNNPRLRPGQPGWFEAASAVAMLDVPQSLDRSMGDVHAQGNPHIHTDPRSFIAVADGLLERLLMLDAAGSDSYRAAHGRFVARWSTAIDGWEKRAAGLRGMRVVSAHQGWPYLYAWLGLTEAAVLEPRPGVPPSTAQLQEVLDSLHEQPARFVLLAAYQSDRAARWLSGRADIPLLVLPYTVGGVDGADDLFGLFERSVDLLLAAGS